MGNVNTYIGNIDKKKNALLKRENDLDKWIFELDMNYPDKVMPDHIYKEIREFYKFQWENDDSSIENFSQFMMKLPSQLRHEMNIYIYKSRIEYLGAFMVGIPESCIYELAAHMKPRFESRAVEIIKKDSKSKLFYVIKTGNLLVVDEEPFLRLYPRSYFGENCILFKEKSDFAYITDADCSLFTINQKVFQKVAKSDLRILSLRAFRRNKYFHLVNQNLNKEEIDDELIAQIEDFNIFSEDIPEEEMQDFEIKLSKLAPSQTSKDEKYLRKIKQLQDQQYSKLQQLEEEIEKIKQKLEDD
jgi:CRP-like cAMP-binding protein